jgi:uncharacterized protein (DUF697 family)
MSLPTKYAPIVKAAAKTAGAIGVPGAFSFGLDVTVMAGIWTTMTVAIAHKSNHQIDRSFAAKLVSAVLGGIAGYIGGSKLAMKLLHFIPGPGTLAAMGVNSFLDFWFTWRLGKGLAQLFDKKDLSTLDIGLIAIHLIAIITPIPRMGEIKEIIAMMRDETLTDPELVAMFQPAKTM